MAASERDYDPTDVKSIVEYSHKLVGKTLREVTDAPELADPHRRRGSFGNAVEEYFFKYPINSDSAPDFADAGLEVKATPVKEVRHGKKRELVAKERLVLGKIDYNAVVNETFETSHVMKKCSDMLLISYLYEPDKNPVDYVVEAVAEWGIPQKDLPQVRADWETVVNKVRAGHAEDISGSDTMYLEACTKSAKGSDRTSQPFSEVPAKPRAWALKASYMTAVQRKIIDCMREIPRSEAEKDLDLLTLVKKRFDPYVGMTAEELQDRFGLPHSKSVTARITNCILGVGDNSEIEEFAKAGIKPKTIRLKRNGTPREAMSFPSFDYFKLLERDFWRSDFYGYMQQKYLFVVFREDEEEKDVYRLASVMFWQMPEADLEEARCCYEQMQANVRAGRAEDSVKSTENRCCHVRPKGRDGNDVRPQPYGEPVVKKCFWLNQKYLAGEIARGLR